MNSIQTMENYDDSDFDEYFDVEGFQSEELIDYSSYFPDALLAQAKGRNVVIIRKIDPIVASKLRADRKRASYEIETRFLSRDARPGKDDFACVEWGPDFEYWQAKELPALHKAIKSGKDFNVFQVLNIH